ncbi:hypothetical protein [Paenibacillus sp. FSL L8-0708]|uniref:hypothetical protein n=1 Tax=Paenibacillus sp. FSL L8-0708 TaxID=2975311 RepID=UPI0030F57989
MDWEETFTRLALTAWQKGDLTEAEYRELHMAGNVQERMSHLADVLTEKRQAQVIKGAEFLESIGPNDPRWEKANVKYDGLVESIRYKPISRDPELFRPSIFDAYNLMRDCYHKYGRIMKKEEIARKLPELAEWQIAWAIFEINIQLNPLGKEE